MLNNAADFETMKQELRNKLADLERDFPDAVDQIATHRCTVDDFCNKEIPTTKDSNPAVVQANEHQNDHWHKLALS